MGLALRPDVSLRFRALPGTFLYDCHGRSFAPLEKGGCVATRLTPLYLGLMFGVAPAEWGRFLGAALVDLKALPAPDRDRYVAERRPRRSAHQALEVALGALPAAARFFDDAHAPSLRDQHLFQPNVALGALEARRGDGEWRSLHEGDLEHDAEARDAIRRVLERDGAAASGVAASGTVEARIHDRLEALDLLAAPARVLPAPPPGVYLTGHSSLLVRGAAAGVLVDPQLTSPTDGERTSSLGAAELGPLADAVAVTHGHFDHYHLPSLLQLASRRLLVPRVPRASLVCEDLAARLRAFGAPDVHALAWGERAELEDVTLHALPFVGEQFLTSEIHPGARNWGNCLVAEHDGVRMLLAVDSGFEAGRSVIDVVADWTRAHGPIDAVFAQAIALRTSFGYGDPDLMITALACAARAHEAVDLMRPERRVTLAARDLPALARAAGARRVVLYGQFVFRRGAPGVHPRLTDRVRRALAEDGDGIECVPLAIGEGLRFVPGTPVARIGEPGS